MLSNTFDYVSLMVLLITQLAFMFFIFLLSQYSPESTAEDSVFSQCLQLSKYRLYKDQCCLIKMQCKPHMILNFLVATWKKKRNRCNKFYVTNYYIAYWIGKFRELFIWCWKTAFQSNLHIIVLIQIDFIEL